MKLNRISETVRNIGPAALVTAAFIGPGTLTTCSLAGASFGYSLLWGLLFSVVATVILQNMSARLGIIGGIGLGEAIILTFTGKISKIVVVILVIAAVGIGNAAYQAGNIMGAAMGLDGITGIETISPAGIQIRIWPPIVGAFAFYLLFTGSYKIIERALITLVIVMSITFITTAIMVKPDLKGVFHGFFYPEIPAGSILMLISLIGTTVVPYNLFLHAAAAREKWKGSKKLKYSFADSAVSIGVGGMISASIVITASVAFFGSDTTITGISDLGFQLEPLLGPAAPWFIAAGIFAAGISSAVTAPLAAAYAITGVLSLDRDMRGKWFRLIWMIVLLAGVILATFGLRPVRVILLAQFTNGLILPFLATFLLFVMNNRMLLGTHVNGKIANIAGIIIIIITLLLGLKSIGSVTGLL